LRGQGLLIRVKSFLEFLFFQKQFAIMKHVLHPPFVKIGVIRAEGKEKRWKAGARNFCMVRPVVTEQEPGKVVREIVEGVEGVREREIEAVFMIDQATVSIAKNRRI